MDDETTSIGRVVPYLLFVGSVLMMGFVFMILNAPVLWQFTQESPPMSEVELLRRCGNLISTAIATAGSASAFLILFLACLISGFVVNMLSEGLATVVGAVAMGLTRLPGIKRFTIGLRLFTYATYFESGHATFRLWLLANPPARLQWEWELFNFALYWGITTNFLIALWATGALVGQIVPSLLGLTVATCAYSLLRSWILLRYQGECMEAMKLSCGGIFGDTSGRTTASVGQTRLGEGNPLTTRDEGKGAPE